eukprot:763900-Hanusia_phi.AAC.1
MALPASFIVYEEEISRLKEKIQRQESELKDLHALIWGEVPADTSSAEVEVTMKDGADDSSEHRTSDQGGGLFPGDAMRYHHLDETLSVSSRLASPEKRGCSHIDRANLSELSQRETPLLREEAEKVQQDWMINFDMASSPSNVLHEEQAQEEEQKIQTSIRELELSVSTVSRLQLRVLEVVDGRTTEAEAAQLAMERNIRELAGCAARVEEILGEVKVLQAGAAEAAKADASIQTERQEQKSLEGCTAGQPSSHVGCKSALPQPQSALVSADSRAQDQAEQVDRVRASASGSGLLFRALFSLFSVLLCTFFSSAVYFDSLSSPSPGIVLQASCPTQEILFRELFPDRPQEQKNQQGPFLHLRVQGGEAKLLVVGLGSEIQVEKGRGRRKRRKERELHDLVVVLTLVLRRQRSNVRWRLLLEGKKQLVPRSRCSAPPGRVARLNCKLPDQVKHVDQLSSMFPDLSSPSPFVSPPSSSCSQLDASFELRSVCTLKFGPEETSRQNLKLDRRGEEESE